jgi:hypothetical protein
MEILVDFPCLSAMLVFGSVPRNSFRAPKSSVGGDCAGRRDGLDYSRLRPC